MIGRILAVVGLSLVGVGSAQAATPVPLVLRSDVEALVATLGSDVFTERDAATRSLERIGAAALPGLRNACHSDDPEIRRRAGAIIERIERAADNVRLLAVRPIRLDYRDVALGSAVNDLRAKTGLNLTLDPKRVANPLRPVTVQTGDLPPWQALAEFCKTAGLHEVFLHEIQPAKPETRRGLCFTPQSILPPTAQNVAIVLADGAGEALPGERASAIRVLALPANFATNRVVFGSGEVTINLDVTPLPGLAWQDVVGVRVRQAIDPAGRPIPASHRVNPVFAEQAFDGGGIIMINGRIAMWNQANGEPGASVPLPNPRIVPLTLRTGDGSAKALKLLEGSVQIEVQLPSEPLFVVEDVTKALGRVIEGPNLNRLTIADVQTGPKAGKSQLKLRLESPSPWGLQQMKARRAGAANVFGGAIFLDAPITPVQAPKFQVLGDDGQVLATSSTEYSNGVTDDGSQMFTELGLTFRGRPFKLVMTGPKTVVVDVPFRLENVPLP